MVGPILHDSPSGIANVRLVARGPLITLRLPCENGRYGCIEAFERLLWTYRLAHPGSPAEQMLSFGQAERVFAEVALPGPCADDNHWLRALAPDGVVVRRTARKLALVDAVSFADASRQARVMLDRYGVDAWEFHLHEGELGAPGAVAVQVA